MAMAHSLDLVVLRFRQCEIRIIVTFPSENQRKLGYIPTDIVVSATIYIGYPTA